MGQSQLTSAADAFAAIALAAIAADGELSVVEARALRQQLEFRQPFRRFSDQQMGELLDRVLAQLRGSSCEALVKQATPLLSVEQRETALAVAAHLIHADHIETQSELSFLAQLQEVFGLDASRSASILEVISLLHRDSLAS
ncbi:MAG: tellurite resistance TerB family protein [Synechococcus sp. WH 8007]|nr:tellurite resistance TerB family protein [Synechococcus sp. WH 8007]